MQDDELFRSFARRWEGSKRNPSPAEVQVAFEAYNRHDLWSRADEVHAGAIILLQDASDALRQAALILLEQRATTPDLLEIIQDAVTRVLDGALLAAVNPETDPIVSSFERLPDGSFVAHPVQDEKD